MRSEAPGAKNHIDIKIADLNIIRKIGEGGMSVVYLAEQISLKRKVAVKVMRMEVANNELDVERFKHEAETIAQLDHPNIINIYNIGQTENGEVFFTMPYLKHGDFSSYLIEDEQEFIALLKSICDGLSYAHERGVVHRDIKPENLLFDKFGNISIADFGIAISKNGNRMTKEHQVVGSAQYMSPEQVRSSKVGTASDIYSLGIVIYERLTGSVPFESDESISILVGHVSSEPPKLPPRLWHWQKLIDRCLAKSAEDRFQSMQELKSELDRIPINTLQRTNLSIQNLFTDDMSHHLKWVIPSLLILFFVILFIINQSADPETSNEIVESIETVNNLNNEIDKQPIIIEEFPYDDLMMQTTEVDSAFIEEINTLLDSAFNDIDNSQLFKPVSNNATDKFLQVLALAPDNVEAKKGLEYICEKYVELIDESLSNLNFNVALRHARSFMLFNDKASGINEHFDMHKLKTLKHIEKIDVSSDEIKAEKIQTLIKIVKVFDMNHPMINRLYQQYELKMGPTIGQKMIDTIGLETIVVSKKLAISTTEVTIENYKKFALATQRKASKCKHKGGGVSNFFNHKTWDHPYFDQTDKHPVSCVTWEDAQAFTVWLSEQSAYDYRLPTAQELFALSEDENSPFEACKSANLSGSESKKIRNKEDKFDCDDTFKFTAPVASFTVNNIGLFDVRGNVSEWAACEQIPCENPMAVGTSWFHGTQSNVLQKYEELEQDSAYSYIGFRVARDI